MRSSVQQLAKHVPMIKFPNRSIPVKIDLTSKPHFFSNGVMPASLSAAPKVSLPESKANIDLRSELPLRFRYRPIEDIEIEDINFGGAEVLMK